MPDAPILREAQRRRAGFAPTATVCVMESAATLVQQVKERLQSQHDGLHLIEDGGKATRLMVRAEMDALWECVELLAQRLDGVEVPQVRDYFAEVHGVSRSEATKPPRRSWRRRRSDQ